MFEEAAPAQAPVAPAATETTLDGEDDDASGPSILLRAAAEMIVDEAERHRHIDAAEALLGLIPTVDLETSVMGVGGEGEEPANEVGAGGPAPVVGEPDAGPSPGGEAPRLGLGRRWHVYFEGRWWQWSELVRALDGYIKIVDRGRHSRFWNGMAGHYQAPAAQPAARAAAAAAAATQLRQATRRRARRTSKPLPLGAASPTR